MIQEYPLIENLLDSYGYRIWCDNDRGIANTKMIQGESRSAIYITIKFSKEKLDVKIIKVSYDVKLSIFGHDPTIPLTDENDAIAILRGFLTMRTYEEMVKYLQQFEE